MKNPKARPKVPVRAEVTKTPVKPTISYFLSRDYQHEQSLLALQAEFQTVYASSVSQRVKRKSNT